MDASSKWPRLGRDDRRRGRLNFARDGLFWMRDVLSPSEIDVLKSAAAENFAEIARTLLLQQALSAVTPTIKYAEVMARDGAL